VALLVFEVLFIIVSCILLLQRYAVAKTPTYVYIITGFGWFCCFFIVFLVPADVAMGMHQRCIQTMVGNVTTFDDMPTCDAQWTITSPTFARACWRLIYWTAFWLCWAICPIGQAYFDAGEFTTRGRLRAAVWENVLFYLVVGVLGAIFLAYLLIGAHLSIADLTGFGMALANAWGLTLLILCMGFGLVEVPRSVWRQSDNQVNLRYCEFMAGKVKEGLEENYVKLKDTVREVLDTAQAIDDPALQVHMQTVLELCPEKVITEVSEYKGYATGRLKDRNKDKDKETPDKNGAVTEKYLAQLHKNLKWEVAEHRRNQAAWNELCHYAFYLQDVIAAAESGALNVESPLRPARQGRFASTLDKLEMLWAVKFQKPVLKGCGIFLGLVSCTVVWNETMVPIDAAFDVKLSMLYWMSKDTYDLSLQLLLGLPFLYMTVCTYYSLFSLNLMTFYKLHAGQQTEGSNLLFNAALLCRLVPALSYNFIINVDEDLHTAFTDIMGNMNVVPLFGSAFSIVFPSLIILFCLANVFDVFTRIAATCPGINRFSYKADFSTTNVSDGQDYLRRERNTRERKLEQEAKQETSFTRSYHGSSSKAAGVEMSSLHSTEDDTEALQPSPSATPERSGGYSFSAGGLRTFKLEEQPDSDKRSSAKSKMSSWYRLGNGSDP